jgi:predicted nucleic acid-binding protein
VILVDAGPLKALVDADDQHHAACVATLRSLHDSLGTVWPALTEAMYLLAGLPRAQEALWDMLALGAIQLRPLDQEDVPRIRVLMRKYTDRPMDMAEAALLRVAEREGIQTIFTVDKKDFAVYRLHGRGRITVIP